MTSANPPEGTERSQPRVSPSKTPEARRLKRFTSDPRYGPKLKQLPQREQRRLRALVTGNQGRQARQETLTAYQTHREARNARDRQRRLDKSVDTALNNISRQLPEARADRMRGHFAAMSWQERRFAQTATREELRERARNGPKTITIDGVEYNPFWYG